MNREEMYQQFGISANVLALGKEVLHDIEDRFASIDERAEINQLKVIHAMQKNRVSESHLWGSTVIMTAVGTHWKKYMRIFSIVKMPWSALRLLVELMH